MRDRHARHRAIERMGWAAMPEPATHPRGRAAQLLARAAEHRRYASTTMGSPISKMYEMGMSRTYVAQARRLRTTTKGSAA